jgi:hypothetical protein
MLSANVRIEKYTFACLNVIKPIKRARGIANATPTIKPIKGYLNRLNVNRAVV